jgi:GAF domain-containing protein
MGMQDPQINPFNRQTLTEDIIAGWQSMLNLASELLLVPAGLITRIDGSEIEIFLSSKSKDNPYPEGFKTNYPDSGFYCEWVAKNQKPMLLPDARQEEMWKTNAAVAMGMISYLGMPIMRPDGVVFGTICFLDRKENKYNETVIKLVAEFKKMIEFSLTILFNQEEVRKREQLVHDLSRIFPICAYCKKVRNEEDEWIPVENFIKVISGKRATHGICPHCYENEAWKDGEE